MEVVVVVDIILNKENRLVNCLFHWSKVEKSSKTEATWQKILIETDTLFRHASEIKSVSLKNVVCKK